MKYSAGQYWLWKASQILYSLSRATGKATFRSRTARSTLARSFSTENSGVCTPITTRPAALYFSAQALT
jgi:hypothetical protein